MSKNNTNFDVLIIYSSAVVKSACDQNYQGKKPFTTHSRQNAYNDSYRYFLQSCRKIGLKVAFATSDDIIGPGQCRSYWSYDKKWIRNLRPCFSSFIYDKFTPKSPTQIKQYKPLTSVNSIQTFNNQKLIHIFRNKLRTYQQFKEFAIPTVAFNHPSRRQLLLAKFKLDNLLQKHKSQFKAGAGYLVKDKNGAGGFKIYKFNFDNPGMTAIIKRFETDRRQDKSLSYVLQPFIDCRNSYVIHKHSGLLDLRLILINDKIIQAYIRIARPRNFRCNEHQGGDLVYLPLNTIPADVRLMAAKIVKNLSAKTNIRQSLYALDFMRDRWQGQLYFIEGNNNPGLDWNHAKRINARKSKDLINIITGKLKTMTQVGAGVIS